MFIIYSLVLSAGADDLDQEATDNQRELRAKDSRFYCPYSHPSVRDVDESVPVPRPIITPYIPKVLIGQSRRSITLKSKYVGHSGGVVSYPSGAPQIRVDATLRVSDYALSVVSSFMK